MTHRFFRFSAILCAAGALLACGGLGLPVQPNGVLASRGAFLTQDSAITFIEAEQAAMGAVREDSAASQGKYVTKGGAWEPFFIAPVPEAADTSHDDSLTVWARVRGLSVQLKTILADGTQKELDWSWREAGAWTWVRFGTYRRSNLGSRFLIIRGGGNGEDWRGLDAVAISASPEFDPTSMPISARITVFWNQKIATAKRSLFGVNDYKMGDPESRADSKYHSALSSHGFQLLRFHRGDLVDRWTDLSRKSWNTESILADLFPYTNMPTAWQGVMNIPRWPQWMPEENGMLRRDHHAAYGELCGALAAVVGGSLRDNMTYWEPVNELEQRYESAGNEEGFADLYLTAARAIRTALPGAQVGGPSMSWENTRFLDDFLSRAGSEVDFVSWHRYATGDAGVSTDELMLGTPYYGVQVRNIRDVVRRRIPNRDVPLFLGEYNINYAWDSGEKRQNGPIGAVWTASVLKHLGEAGLDMASYWNAKDGIYGAFDNDNNPRPVARVFEWMNSHFVGAVSATASDHPFIEAFAVEGGSGRALLLINKSAALADVAVEESAVGTERSMPSRDIIDIIDDGNSSSVPRLRRIAGKIAISLRPYSLTLVLEAH